MKNFGKVEKTGIIATKVSVRCTPSVILGGRPKIFFWKMASIHIFFWTIHMVIGSDFLNILIPGSLCANPLDFGGNRSKAWIAKPPHRSSGFPTVLQYMSVCVWYCETLYVSTKGQVPWVKTLSWNLLLHLGQTFVKKPQKFVLILKAKSKAISVCLTKIGLNTNEHLPQKVSKLKRHDLGI